jgi:hypothetical protein
MPLFNMDFVAAGGLLVSYRASAEPQELVVEVDASAPPEAPMAHFCARALVEAINEGGAGGADFAPSRGFAERVAGPWDGGPEAMATSYRWTLRVAGVAPLFMRNFVEELRRAGMGQPITRVLIRGALPLDDGPLSVTERTVRAWLDDSGARLPQWPGPPGFALDTSGTSRGASLRVELAAPASKEIRGLLERLSLVWLNAVRNYTDEDGDEVFFNSPTMLPYFGHGKTEFRARWHELLYDRDPAVAMLASMLMRFHERVAPLREAEIRA